jgi:hypothetical protein
VIVLAPPYTTKSRCPKRRSSRPPPVGASSVSVPLAGPDSSTSAPAPPPSPVTA